MHFPVILVVFPVILIRAKDLREYLLFLNVCWKKQFHLAQLRTFQDAI